MTMQNKIRFIVRSVEENDLHDLKELAHQSSLVSLPPDKSLLNHLVQSSIRSFAGQIPFKDAVYIFVLEDLFQKKVIGESLVHASCASEVHPYYFFNIIEKTKKDPQLNIEMTHQALRLSSETGGLSMCGGLILDREFHSRPEELGSVIALTRFIYMGMFKEQFNPTVLSEVVAPLSKEGSNPFWDAVGKPFTGINFERFLELSRQGNMDFAGRLLPEEDIYFCLLDKSVQPSEERLRQTVGKLAKHIIERVGFRYMKRIHLHGGPILGVDLEEIRLIKEGAFFKSAVCELPQSMAKMAFLGAFKNSRFTGGHFPVIVQGERACLDKPALRALDLEENEPIFLCPADTCRKRN